MPALQWCTCPQCMQLTASRCFECERPFCRDHLTRFQLSLAGSVRWFSVCDTCLVAYLADADMRRIITCAHRYAPDGHDI